MADLMDAIARRQEPHVSGADNLGTMAVIEAGYRSVREHRPVEISEIRDHANAFSKG